MRQYNAIIKAYQWLPGDTEPEYVEEVRHTTFGLIGVFKDDQGKTSTVMPNWYILETPFGIFVMKEERFKELGLELRN